MRAQDFLLSADRPFPPLGVAVIAAIWALTSIWDLAAVGYAALAAPPEGDEAWLVTLAALWHGLMIWLSMALFRMSNRARVYAAFLCALFLLFAMFFALSSLIFFALGYLGAEFFTQHVSPSSALAWIARCAFAAAAFYYLRRPDVAASFDEAGEAEETDFSGDNAQSGDESPLKASNKGTAT